MTSGLARVVAGFLAFVIMSMPNALSAQGTAVFTPQQLDQITAPVALYPDPLLAQILMAATYPLEVVELSRWVQDPNNARLRGDQLAQALQPQDWDPSVKSLAPFPRIVQMMNSRLDWMQQLGDAFLAQQADVMDSVQRLRAEAQAAGTLQPTSQESVSTQGQTIVIEPASPQVVYVPVYDPRVAYGPWAYPAYPPVYFPPPPGYVGSPGLFFGVGIGIVGALWGWDDWDWDHRRVHIDPDRYNIINNYYITREHRPRFESDTWEHDAFHRRGVPYRDPGSRQRFEAAARPRDAGRDYRGYDNSRRAAFPAPQRQPEAGRGAPPPRGQRPQDAVRPPDAGRGPPPPGQRPQDAGRQPPPAMQQRPQPPAQRLMPVQRPQPPAFAGYARAPDIRQHVERGQASRQSMPAAASVRGAPPNGAPTHGPPPNGGQGRGGAPQRPPGHGNDNKPHQ